PPTCLLRCEEGELLRGKHACFCPYKYVSLDTQGPLLDNANVALDRGDIYGTKKLLMPLATLGCVWYHIGDPNHSYFLFLISLMRAPVGVPLSGRALRFQKGHSINSYLLADPLNATPSFP